MARLTAKGRALVSELRKDAEWERATALAKTYSRARLKLETKIPEWLIDPVSRPGTTYVIHTVSPRFVARIYEEDEAPAEALCQLPIDGGWVAVPVEWFDRRERTTADREKLSRSLNGWWQEYDRKWHRKDR